MQQPQDEDEFPEERFAHGGDDDIILVAVGGKSSIIKFIDLDSGRSLDISWDMVTMSIVSGTYERPQLALFSIKR